VLLPAPDEPTQAVGRARRGVERDAFQDQGAGTYSKRTVSNAMSPATSASGARAPRPRRPRLTSRRISRMRSSPANASVIWVPMDAMLISGEGDGGR